MPLLGATGGGSAKGFGALANLGYFIRNSLRFRTGATPYLNRTPASTGNRQIMTFSFWMKRGLLTYATNYLNIFTAYPGASNIDMIGFNPSSDSLSVRFNGAASAELITTQVFRDTSAWYHIVVAIDTTQATAANRIKMYVNGTQITSFSTATYPSQNYNTYWNSSSYASAIGTNLNGPQGSFDGYLAEVNFIDGQALTPSSFGKTDAATGQWIPKKFAGTYGTNGFYLKFADASAATAAAIGKDSSPNGNNWTPNNISVTSGTTYDAMTDSPTLTSATVANYAVANPLNAASGLTISDGNLKLAASASGSKFVNSSIALPSSGAFYGEITFANASISSIGQNIGVALASRSLTAAATDAGAYLFYASTSGSLISNGTQTASSLSAISANEVFQFAVDVTNSKMWIGRSNVWYNSTGGTTGNPSTGANPTFTTAFADYFIYAGFDTTSAVSANFNFGQRPFAYTPPTGFKSLNAFNLP